MSVEVLEESESKMMDNPIFEFVIGNFFPLKSINTTSYGPFEDVPKRKTIGDGEISQITLEKYLPFTGGGGDFIFERLLYRWNFFVLTFLRFLIDM